MKQYKVVKAFSEDGELGGALDLVNINDDTDRHMASDEDFTEEEVVNESDIYFENAPYVTEQGVGNAPFAFRKKKWNDPGKYHAVFDAETELEIEAAIKSATI